MPKEIELSAEDLVIADAAKPIALAGVKGGAASSVDENTTDLLLETATFTPSAVRRSSRRHGIASDSSYRFERQVPDRQVPIASERLLQLILSVAGGEAASNHGGHHRSSSDHDLAVLPNQNRPWD